MRGDALDVLAQLLHLRALAGERGGRFGLAAQAQVFTTQLVSFEGALDGDEQLAHGQRFFDEVIGPEARGLDGGLDRAVSRDHDHRHFERPGLATIRAAG